MNCMQTAELGLALDPTKGEVKLPGRAVLKETEESPVSPKTRRLALEVLHP
jgi:hypothetical protein